MLLAWRDKDRQHNPMTITDQVNLGAKASPRTSQRMVFWLFELRRLVAAQCGMVQKRRFSGNTPNLSADPDRSRVGAGFRESLAALLGLQFRENRVYPRSSSQ